VFDDGRLKTAKLRTASEGSGCAPLRGDVSGYAHSTEITEAACGRGKRDGRGAARGCGSGTWRNAPASDQSKALYRTKTPIAGAAFPVKGSDTLREIDDFARSLDPVFVQVSGLYFCLHPRSRNTAPEGTIRPRMLRPNDAGSTLFGDR